LSLFILDADVNGFRSSLRVCYLNGIAQIAGVDRQNKGICEQMGNSF
jgi:hypothetical protein